MRIAIAMVGLAAALGARPARADGPWPRTFAGALIVAQGPDLAFTGTLIRIDDDPGSREARGRRAVTPIDAHTRTEDACPEVMLPLDAALAVGCLAIVVTDGGARQRVAVRARGERTSQNDDACTSWCSDHPGRVPIEIDVDRSPPRSYAPDETVIERTATYAEARAIVFPRVVSFVHVELRGRRAWRTSTTITPPLPPSTGITIDRDYGYDRDWPSYPTEPVRLTFAVDEPWRGVTSETIEVRGYES